MIQVVQISPGKVACGQISPGFLPGSRKGGKQRTPNFTGLRTVMVRFDEGRNFTNFAKSAAPRDQTWQNPQL
jgi:hypothetical protein